MDNQTPDDPQAPLPFERIGKYEIVRQLGSGGTSCVYLAQDPFNNQQVALKLFHANPPRKSMRANVYRKLLQTEASLAGKLSHPHIVKMFDAVLLGEINYMVMEYVEGETLEKYTQPERLLSPGMVAEIMYKCGNALEYAQRQGVIHRDIKPANILMQPGGDIKIADFGAAVIESQQASQQLTQVPGVGSPAFMSPEQIQEFPLTHQTDIYSLGVTFFTLLTGRLPFNSENNYSLLYQIIHEEAPRVRSLRHDIPEQLDAIVQRAMHKDQSQRYQTWGEFTRDLASFFGNKPDPEAEIFDTEKFETLRQLDFFRNVGDTELWEVLRIIDWRRIPPGECILRENDKECAFFIIASGTVKVTKRGSELNRLHKGDCFGEMKRFPDLGYLRATSVYAETDVALIEINLDVLAQASIECRFQFDDAFLYILLKRLDAAHTRISSLLYDR